MKLAVSFGLVFGKIAFELIILAKLRSFDHCQYF